MSKRFAISAVSALVLTTGLSASAYSMSLGLTDQAIAFGWPTIALSLLIAMLAPASSRA